MDEPAHIVAAKKAKKAFELQLGVAVVLGVAVLFTALGLEDMLGKTWVLIAFALASLPALGVAVRGAMQNVNRDISLVEAWKKREIKQLVEPEPPPPDPVDESARWKQVDPLLSRLRQLVEEGDQETLDAAVVHLRRLAADLELLDGAIAVEEGFGDASPRRSRLDGALGDAEAEWAQVLGLLRDLHLELSTRDRPAETLAALDDLVHQSAAQAEVERASRLPREAVPDGVSAPRPRAGQREA